MNTPSEPPATLSPAGSIGPTERVLAWLVLALVLVAQVWESSRLFPSLAALWNSATPLVMVDHAIHEYHGRLGADFFRAHGTTWGYDPYFMAGYPETPIWDSSSNLAIALNLIGGQAASFRAYKVGIFALPIVGMFALILGGRAAGLGLGELALAAALAWFYFWVEQPVALLRTGLVGFLAAGMGSALLLGLCPRVHQTPAPLWTWVALALTGAGLFFTHVTAPILVGPGALAFYLMVARQHDRRWHLKVWAAVGMTVALNLGWLIPLWHFRGLRVGSAIYLVSNSAWYLWDYYLAPSLDARTGLGLLILGSLGLVGWWFGGRRAATAAFGGSIGTLVLLTGFGSLWEPTRTMEPLRFRVVFCLLLTLPAASCLRLGPPWLTRKLGGGRRARWTVALGLTLATLGLIRLNSDFFKPAASWLTHRRPIVIGYPPESKSLVNWIKQETDLSARIMLEDQLRLLETFDAESTHWTPLLPALLAPDARLFLGGLYQTAFIQHHQAASFGDFQLGRRAIDLWKPDELAAYTQRYNVGWVVCWSPLSRFVWDRYPGATRLTTLPRLATPGKPPANNERERESIIRRAGVATARKYILEGESTYAVYRLERPHSYFVRGRGQIVSVAPNRIEMADVEPDAEGVAVLSTHWLDTWRTEPPTAIRREPIPDDPVPFVRIETKTLIPRLILRNGY